MIIRDIKKKRYKSNIKWRYNKRW